METIEVPSFGRLLRGHRRASGMTQESLAERTGLSVRAIGDLERDVGHVPRKDTVELLIDALDLLPSERRQFEMVARTRVDSASRSRQERRTPQVGSFLGALPHGPLIGRGHERRRVLPLIDAAAEGSGRFVMLVGDPGVGKTRLAQEVALETWNRGFCVATGRCYEPERTVPFYPFLEALSTAYAAAPESVREQVAQQKSHIARLLPGHDLSSSRSTGDGQADQQQLFLEVTAFLQAIAVNAPVVLLLDDLHWADTASLRLLSHLVRRTRTDRVLLLGTYRDIDVERGHPLERALVDLNRERLVERVVVRQFDLQGTGELIRTTIGEIDASDELRDIVYRGTEGNPFFVQEVLHALVERGDLYQEGGRWIRRDIEGIHVPDTVGAAIGERLSRLRPQSQTLLEEASVLGQKFSFDDLRGMGGRREEDVEVALEDALGSGLIREISGDSYVFGHALGQQALYSSLSARRKQRLHLAVGEMLAHLPEGMGERRAGEIAWHFFRANEPGRALPYAMLAAEGAEQTFAYREAERYYRSILEAIASARKEQRDVSPTLEAQAMARLGRVLNIMERYDEALEALEEASVLFRDRGDLAAEGPVVAEIGWLHVARGTAAEGVARIQPLVTVLEQEADSTATSFALASLYTALARLSFGLGQYRDELLAAARASELAQLLGDDLVLAVAETRRGSALMALGRGEEAGTVLEAAATLAESTKSFGTMSVALENLAHLYRDAGDFRRSQTYYRRALEAAEQTAVPGRIAWSLTKVGHIALLLGDWQEAGARFERALEIARSRELPWPIAYFLVHAEQLALLRGRPEEGVHYLEDAIDAAAARQDIWIERHAQRLMAEHDILRGHPEEAVNRLAPFLKRQGRDDPQLGEILPTLAWAHIETGDQLRAEEVLSDCNECIDRDSNRLGGLDVARVRGMLRARQERWDDARASFREARALASNMPYPHAEGRVLYELGMTYVRTGHFERAREHLEPALTIFRRLGAKPDIQRAERAQPD